MNLTVNYPGKMSVIPSHVADNRTLVYADADNTSRALTLWMTPADAAQWIEALTPLAEGKP